jgi:hypothetical protein
VVVERNASGHATRLKITEHAERSAWAELAHGAYLLRTNCTETDPVATVRSMDVVLPVKECHSQETCPVRLRVVARPDRLVAELLIRLGLELPSVPKLVQNVVEKNRG